MAAFSSSLACLAISDPYLICSTMRLCGYNDKLVWRGRCYVTANHTLL